jgi:hypothetical protein
MGTDEEGPFPSFQGSYQIAHIVILKMDTVKHDLAAPGFHLFNHRKGEGQDMPEDAYRKNLPFHGGAGHYPFQETAGIVPGSPGKKKIEESHGVGCKTYKGYGTNLKNDKKEPDMPVTGGLFLLFGPMYARYGGFFPRS